jgi:Holliday junction resolvase RusA-like endonuclease
LEGCLVCGFHKDLKKISESYPKKIAIKAEYNFNIPIKKFFTLAGDITKCDVTNMLKAVEDSILGEIIDDRYVLESVIRKNPTEDEFYSIHAAFDFYSYKLVREK